MCLDCLIYVVTVLSEVRLECGELGGDSLDELLLPLDRMQHLQLTLTLLQHLSRDMTVKTHIRQSRHI